jgi:peptidoglycan hydrolase CwlO-like protein/surface antigen
MYIRMKKINIPKTKFKKIAGTAGSLIAILILVFAIFPRVQEARAESVQDKINALQRENAQYQSAIARLASEATSYEDAINKLKAQIDTLQGQINASTKEQERLQNEITEAEKELTKQKALLGKNIKAMYLEGDISTIEMLASSKDLSEFVDKAQYRNSVKDKIRESVDKITKLKQELVAKKEGVEALLKQQQEQQATLDNSRSEQANLLSYNQNQQNDFNSRTKDNQSKIDALIASQRRANFNPDGGYYFLRFPGGVSAVNPNNYPYKNAGFGMSPGPGCVDNDGPDQWGYCTRQCVSYAAWAVEASGRSAPRYYGNARDWVAAAYARGITVSRTPQPGDVAISTSGYWGHAMYVESVGNGTFNTSEYNTYLNGQLSYQTRRY